MGEKARIAEQLKRAFEGHAWHGPAVLQVLEGVAAKQASARPIPGAHTIWEIALHVAVWKDVVRRRMNGEKFELSDAEDWPPPAVSKTTDAAWRAAIRALKASHKKLLDTLEALPENRLGKSLVPGGSTGYVQLHGVIQHDIYHAGQIAVLKKGRPR
ncbi:MAG TPA: DinB family protein [Candidatus Limnocylindria bacterium]|nr:DinB family protein [Candidatus Limnocylindria bacterium]